MFKPDGHVDAGELENYTLDTACLLLNSAFAHYFTLILHVFLYG